MRAKRAYAGFVLTLALSLCFPQNGGAATREKTSIAFLRGAYVLRHLYPGEHWPPVNVPRKVRVDDTTNALIMHRDRNFVLGAVARDLTAAAKSGKHPEAGYYAAHAHAMLGEHAEAANAMARYLAKAAFRDEDYLFLVRERYESGDYKGVREAAATWQSLDGRDDSCSEDRLSYVWGSFFAEGLHREAMEAVLSDPCASWKGQLLFARSCLALGDEKGADERIKALVEATPGKERDILVLWNRLATAARYP